MSYLIRHALWELNIFMKFKSHYSRSLLVFVLHIWKPDYCLQRMDRRKEKKNNKVWDRYWHGWMTFVTERKWRHLYHFSEISHLMRTWCFLGGILCTGSHGVCLVYCNENCRYVLGHSNFLGGLRWVWWYVVSTFHCLPSFALPTPRVVLARLNPSLQQQMG